MIEARLKEEIKIDLDQIETVVVAGGGANAIKLDIFGKKTNIVVPDEPEFSQVRGYLKVALNQVEI